MARYAACFWKNNTDSVRQIAELAPSANQRIRVDFFSVGCVSTPADAMFTYVVRRPTNGGSATFGTVTPLDPNDAAPRTTLRHIVTVDATSFAAAAEVFRTPCHHRATYTFAAGDGQELVSLTSGTNAISLGLDDASASLFEGVLMFKE